MKRKQNFLKIKLSIILGFTVVVLFILELSAVLHFIGAPIVLMLIVVLFLFVELAVVLHF